MTKLKIAARGVLLAAALGLPSLAQAQGYAGDYPSRHDYHNDYHHNYNHHYRHYRTCGADRRRRGNNGTAVGAVSGGVLGAALGGGKFGNVLLGAGAGAVAGHEIGKHSTRC